jgi:hypothetical protein
MARPIIVAVLVAASLGGVAAAFPAAAQDGRLIGDQPPYHDRRDAGRPPLSLLPNIFPPWVPGCWHERVVRTPEGWQRQRVWVCS